MIEDLITAEAEASEHDKDAPIRPGTKLTRGHGRSRTLQVRLNVEELQALTTLARQRGIPASTLARDLLLPHLSGADNTPRSVIARLRADLDTLASAVA